MSEEVKINEEQTATVTVANEEEDTKVFIKAPIFILFAEYLGYVSMLIELAEEWCDPKKPYPSAKIQSLLRREARTIYDEMLEEYAEDEIKRMYAIFYTCGIDELELDLEEKVKKFGDDLPF